MRHTFTHSKLKCSKCDIVFKSKADLDKHFKIHESQPKEFTCNVCNEKFDFNHQLMRHTFTHDMVFKSKTDLDNHAGAYPLLKSLRFKCSKCDRIFRNETLLDNHIRTYHVLNPPKYIKCQYCWRKFAKQTSLEAHLVQHGVWPMHECQFCQKKFALKTNLEVHLEGHKSLIEKEQASLRNPDSNPIALPKVDVAKKGPPSTKCANVSSKVVNQIVCVKDLGKASNQTTSPHSPSNCQKSDVLNVHSSEAPYVIKIKVEEDI